MTPLDFVRIVLDTSVLVAAWRSQLGASYEILEAVDTGLFEIAVSVPLIAEYESALLRHLSGTQRPHHVQNLIDELCSVAVRQKIFFLWRPLLPDSNDDMVVEVAIASGSSASSRTIFGISRPQSVSDFECLRRAPF